MKNELNFISLNEINMTGVWAWMFYINALITIISIILQIIIYFIK